MARKPDAAKKSEIAWWKAWRRRDYSWEGLRNHQIGWDHGGPKTSLYGKMRLLPQEKKFHGTIFGDNTLQDYWRRDPVTGARRSDEDLIALGELVWSPAGQGKKAAPKLWHIAHVPLNWENGSPAKSAWGNAEEQRLTAVLQPRLQQAAVTDVIDDGSGISVKGPDGRAQFVGCVLREAPLHPEGREAALNICAARAYIFGADYEQQAFGPGTDFGFCYFAEEVYFNGAHFQGGVRLDSAIFCANNFWETAVFDGIYARSEVKSFGKSYFDKCVFKADAIFTSSKFYGEVFFYGSKFRGQFAQFYGCSFFRESIFGYAKFKTDVLFRKVQFKKGVSFFRAEFYKRCVFDNTQFAAGCDFEAAKLNKYMSFSETKFNSVDSAIFKSWIVLFIIIAILFSLNYFGQNVKDWVPPTLNQGNWIYKAIDILKYVFYFMVFLWLFVGLEFVSRDDVSFNDQLISFRNIKQLCAEVGNKQGEVLFHALELKSIRVLKDEDGEDILLLPRIRKIPEIILSMMYDISAGYGQAIFKPVFSLLALVLLSGWFYWQWEGGGFNGAKLDIWPPAVSTKAAPATLPVEKSNKPAPSSKAPPRKSAPPAPHPASHAQVHPQSGPPHSPDADFFVLRLWNDLDPSLTEAIGFSVRNVFRPFGVWNAEFVQDEENCGFQARLLVVGHSAPALIKGTQAVTSATCKPRGVKLTTIQAIQGHRLLVRLAASAQSICSGILIFLFGLSLRRRFQIS